MRPLPVAALLLVGAALAAGPQYRWKARREAPVPAPPAWLRGAALAACPGSTPTAYEAYFAKGGAWLVKFTDGRTGSPREVLFLGGRNAGRVLSLGEVFYNGSKAQVGQGGAVYHLSYRE